MGQRQCARVLALLCCGLLTGAPVHANDARAAPVPLKDFARDAEYSSADISPDGRFLALKQPFEDQTILVVFNIKAGKISGALRLGRDQHVYDHWWVSPDRVVVTIAEQFGSLEQPRITGELVGMDADGKRLKYLYGYRSLDQFGSRARRVTPQYAAATMVDPLPDDPRNALISTRPYFKYEDQFSRAQRLDVMNGQLWQVGVAPKPGEARFLADPTGEVRYVSVRDSDLNTQTFWRERRKDDWKPVASNGLDSHDVIPLTFSADGNTVYFKALKTGNLACLIAQPVAEGAMPVELACDDGADLDNVIWLDGQTPLAAVFQAGYPKLKPLPTTAVEDWTTYRELISAFKGQFVLPVSRTRDSKLLVLQVFSDRNPGSFYLFDREKRQLEALFAERSWIDAERMSKRTPFSVKTKDGHTVWGYLTLPPGSDGKSLPLIVHPHGGPFGVRDEWRWDADPQMLASRGYAVLQVNFRGSAGYGSDHLEAGRYEWGGAMIDDLLAATDWAVAQGHADPARICSYGASYGAYAAVMLAIRAPERFRCVIGYAGAYDLELMARDSDIPDSRFGREYIRNYIGKDDAALRAQSPVHLAQQLKAPILIAHGKEDLRTPLSQAESLRDALDELGHPYEWLVKPREGHGFYIKENRIELYEQMLAFLDRHIGSPGPDPVAPAAADGAGQ